MSRPTAQALAGGGALVSVVSLLTPWYVQKAGALTGLGESGAQALGVASLILVALALLAGASASARLHPALPVGCAAGLALLVLYKFASPPSAIDLLTAPGGDQIQTGFTRAFAHAAGLHYEVAWGIWLAAIGAAAALAGTIAAAARS